MPDLINLIVDMVNQGLTEQEIIQKLSEQGYSPRDINDALNQLRIQQQMQQTQEMTPSIISQEEKELEVPTPQQQEQVEAPVSETQGVIEQPGQYGIPQEYQYPQQPIEEQTETIEEIAEEIINEKWSEFKEEIGDFSEFKREINSKVNILNDRIKRIEIALDRLQASLIGKVQEYSKNIRAIGSEVRMVEDSFGKILNPLVDNIKELRKLTEEFKKIKPKNKEKKKSKTKKRK